MKKYKIIPKYEIEFPKDGNIDELINQLLEENAGEATTKERRIKIVISQEEADRLKRSIEDKSHKSTTTASDVFLKKTLPKGVDYMWEWYNGIRLEVEVKDKT